MSNDHGLVYKSIKAHPVPFLLHHPRHVDARLTRSCVRECARAFPHRTRTNDPARPLVKHTAHLSSAHNMFSSLATLLLLPMAPLATYFPLSRKSPFFGDLSGERGRPLARPERQEISCFYALNKKAPCELPAMMSFRRGLSPDTFHRTRTWERKCPVRFSFVTY